MFLAWYEWKTLLKWELLKLTFWYYSIMLPPPLTHTQHNFKKKFLLYLVFSMLMVGFRLQCMDLLRWHFNCFSQSKSIISFSKCYINHKKMILLLATLEENEWYELLIVLPKYKGCWNYRNHCLSFISDVELVVTSNCNVVVAVLNTIFIFHAYFLL